MTEMIDEIKRYVKEEKLAIGTESVLKLIRNGGVTKVFLAANAPADVRDDIEHYAGLGDIEVVVLHINNDELGNICKKPFSIAVMGLLK